MRLIDETIIPPNEQDGELILCVKVPKDQQDRLANIAEAYAVFVANDIPGGCIVWGRYRGEWQANQSCRWLVTMLTSNLCKCLNEVRS